MLASVPLQARCPSDADKQRPLASVVAGGGGILPSILQGLLAVSYTYQGTGTWLGFPARSGGSTHPVVGDMHTCQQSDGCSCFSMDREMTSSMLVSAIVVAGTLTALVLSRLARARMLSTKHLMFVFIRLSPKLLACTSVLLMQYQGQRINASDVAICTSSSSSIANTNIQIPQMAVSLTFGSLALMVRTKIGSGAVHFCHVWRLLAWEHDSPVHLCAHPIQ